MRPGAPGGDRALRAPGLCPARRYGHEPAPAAARTGLPRPQLQAGAHLHLPFHHRLRPDQRRHGGIRQPPWRHGLVHVPAGLRDQHRQPSLRRTHHRPAPRPARDPAGGCHSRRPDDPPHGL